MKMTELVVTGYHDDQMVWAARLTPGLAKRIIVEAGDGQMTVAATGEQTTQAFESVCGIIDELATPWT